ncbi:MAG TPA: hypothetical protein PK581_09255, partial [Caldisericia bacterium]|nr:hypothetical protein [Caldisericia bacterium]
MKKALSWLVTFLMVAGILQIGTAPSISKAANEAQNASFIAVRFMPPYYNRDGKELPQGKKYPWQKGFDASMVEGGINAIYWTDFYLDINPAGGKSQGTHHWFGLLDDQGQLWLDPDGTFDYVAYNPSLDPTNLGGQYIDGACKDGLKHTGVTCSLSETALTDCDANWKTDQWAGATVTVQGQNKRIVLSNDRDTLVLMNSLSYSYPETLKEPGKKVSYEISIASPITSSINTQGPYKLMNFVKKDYEPIYFWDRNITNRKFRLAFCNIDSYQLELGSEGRKFQPSTVKGGDFDIAYRLFDFVYWGEASEILPTPPNRFNLTGAPPPVNQIGDPLPEFQKTVTERIAEGPYNQYHWYYNSTNVNQMHVHGGDELHTDNVSDFNQSWRVVDPVKPGPGGTGYNDQYLGYANISTYEPGEFIYRKGTHRDSSNNVYYNLKYLVEEGDIRLTPVTVVVGTENRNYPPGAIVKHTDWDCAVQWTGYLGGHGVTDTPPDPNPTVSKIFKELFRFRVHFNDVGERSPYQKDEVHAENVKTTADYGYYPSKVQGLNNRGWNRFDLGEWIYKDDDSNPPWGTVSVGDARLTNVNVPLLDREGNQVVQNIIGAGDLLILAEVLFGGCNAPDYNLSIQSDVWMADVDERAMPDAFTAASLKFQTSDFRQAQTVQKNTFLDPDGSKFFVPATTFQNVRLSYREYLGIQLFKDDGVNNMLSPTSVGELGKAVAHNLSDDYIEGKVGEEFIGADDQNIEDADFDRPLLSFTEDIMFYDTGNLEYGCGEAIYRNENTNTFSPNTPPPTPPPSPSPPPPPPHDPDAYHIVNDGDIRLTDVVVTQGNNVISYKAGSRVSPGDADAGRRLHFFTHEHRFFDQDWPDLSIPRNYLYDISENIYKISEEPVPLIPGVVPTFRFGTVDYSNVLYYDVDGSGTITPGDIRVFDLANRFMPGSVVGVGMYNNPDLISPTLDADVSAWIKIDVPNSSPNPVNSNLPYFNRIRSAYVDRDNDGYISIGDIRLARIYDHPAYTMVQAGDKDITPAITPPANPSLFTADHVWYDLYQKNQIILVPNASTPDITNRIRITPYSVFVNVTRLTPVKVANRFYECGSIVQYKYEYWNMRNPVYGISMGKNGDHRFIDWEVLPSKELGLKVNIDNSFRVEQTARVDIAVDPPLRPARWENGIYYPAEKVYVMLRDTEGPYGQLIHEDYREITADNPYVTFKFTPYRGTCNSNGVSSGLKKVWVPGKDGQPGYYKTTAYDLRVRIVAFKDDGGYNEMDQVPPSKKLVDPFWESFYNPIVEGTRYSQYPWSPPPYPIPPFPPSMQHGYDCFSDYRYEVAPEELKFIPSTKCVGLLDQRFPNLTLKLKDADNPLDVNDPQGITVSVPDGEEVAVIYNANGGGIEYMFTGFMKEPTRGILYGNKNKPVSDTNVSTSMVDRIIGQVNTDGTMVYWHWKDIGPHPGMLDEGDIVWVPNAADAGIDPALWPSTVPGYIKIIDRQITKNLINNDCSIETPSCKICGSGSFNKFGYVSYGDTYGPFFIATYGVPSYIRNYGEETRTATDEGGEILVTVIPQDAMSKLKLQVYSYNILFDYNSTIKHPPYFIVDEAVGNFAHDVDFDFKSYNGSGLQRYSYMGIDYCGVHEFKVLPSDPYLNFAEMSIVDHGLQNSRVNYTAPSEDAQGQKRGLSPLAIPTPQIQSPYNPMVLDVGKDFRAYPGGQSHTGRVKGAIVSGGVARTDTDHSGWNAYPAIWWWFWHAGTNQTNFTDFNKLGTEFFPMTDYGVYFILKDIDGNHLSFSEDVAIDQRLRRIEVVGSYARPKVFNEARNTIRSDYEYNGTKHVPIVYDWTGKIIIDRSNYLDFEYALGDDWTRLDGQNDPYDYVNPFLRETKRLDYRSMRNVFRIEEIIPIGQSVLQLRVTLWDGTVKIYQDCCAEPPTDGVDTHALNVVSDLNSITADVDNKIVATITEASSMQEEKHANDALVYAWQDRGVLNPRTRLFDGAGDGWVTNPPRSSLYSGVSPQYERSDDLNGDGKVSFADYETEIIGTYDMATNTWAGGVIDARTFQRNNGQYVFDLSSSNGALINTVGIDFGGNSGKPDHIISDFERLPVMITAYKYGDDNNDRAFTPLYNFGGNQGQYSHEVYLAGQKFIEVAP